MSLEKEKFDPEYCYTFRDGSTEFFTLDDNHMEELKDVIRKFLVPIKTKKCGSYFLKHQLEHAMSCKYISNADCKKAMDECGFPYTKEDGLYWNFGVSKKSLDNLTNYNRGLSF